jgi:hypothetical protein
MQFVVKLCCVMAVGFVTFRIAFVQSDYIECLQTAREFREAALSLPAHPGANPATGSRPADEVSKKYLAYRQAELKWANDLKWLAQ